MLRECLLERGGIEHLAVAQGQRVGAVGVAGKGEGRGADRAAPGASQNCAKSSVPGRDDSGHRNDGQCALS